MAGELRQKYAEWAEDAVSAADAVFGDAFEGAVVFGSVGRNTPHDGSDIDLLLVISDLPEGRTGRAAAAAEVEGFWRRSVGPSAPELSLVLRTPAEVDSGFPLVLEIAEDGRVLRDPHGVTGRLLLAWHERMVHAKAKRIHTGESWHWDLQGDSRPGGWKL